MKSKKIVIGVIAIILSVIGMISFSICNLASENVKYSFKLYGDLTLKNIFINNNKIPLGSITSQNVNLMYDEEKDELIGMGEAEVSIKASSIDNVYFEFSDTENSNIVFKKNEITQELEGNYYNYNISILSIIAKCFNGYSIIYFVLLLPLMYFSIYSIYAFFNKIKENELKIINIIFFILSVFAIYITVFYIILAISEILLLIILILSLALGIYFLRNNIKENIKNIFVYTVTIIGIAMLFLIPPFNVPDEYGHFIKSYVMSEHLTVKDNGYADIPSVITAFSNKYAHSVNEKNIKYDGVNYFSDIYLGCKYYDLEETEVSNINYTNTRYLSIFTYIPSALMLFVLKHLGLSPLLLLIFTRFIDLFIVIILAYVAISIAPKFKKVFFIVCLFPIFLQQSAAINQDYLTNILCILFVAYVLKCKYSKNVINTKNMLVFLGLGIAISLCKFGYFPIILTMFLIPNKNFRSKKEAILFKLGVFLCTLLISYIVSFILIPESPIQEPNKITLGYILKHPINSIKVYTNTLLIRLHSDVLTGLFDGFLYSTVSMSKVLKIITILLYLLLIFIYDEADDKLTKKSRALLIFITIFIFAIVYSAAYTWNEIGVDVITGVQSRYFIPALLVLYMGISSSFVKFKTKNKNLVYSSIMLIIYIIVIFTIINGVYR